MNIAGKLLVLVQVTLSMAAMTWAMLSVLLAKDFGWREPAREVVEWTKEGAEKTVIRYASEHDKSTAALKEAVRLRDLTYIYVKPAMDELRQGEHFLWQNHLYFVAQLKEMRESPDTFDVRRFQPLGLKIEPSFRDLGKPELEAAKVDGVNKSKKTYEAELKKLRAEIATVEEQSRKVLILTKRFTAELTGTDDNNKYVQPGLYQLTDVEFKTQSELKVAIEAIKPDWSKAVEQARLFMARRGDLEETLSKLLAPELKKINNGKQ